MTLLRRFWNAAVALDPSAAQRDEGRCMPFCTRDELGELWSATGLGDVTVVPVVLAARYAGFEDLRQPLELGVGPSGAYTVSLAPDHRAALKDELRHRLGAGDAFGSNRPSGSARVCRERSRRSIEVGLCVRG